MEPNEISMQGDDFLPTRSSEEIDLVDERGNTFQWEVFYSFSLNGFEYLVFLPTSEAEFYLVNVELDDPDSDVPGYIVLRIGNDESGDEILEEIVDPDELEEVAEFVEDEIGLLGKFLNSEE